MALSHDEQSRGRALAGDANTRYILPKASVTVLAGKLGD
jgi:hypothetical protein